MEMVFNYIYIHSYIQCCNTVLEGVHWISRMFGWTRIFRTEQGPDGPVTSAKPIYAWGSIAA